MIITEIEVSSVEQLNNHIFLLKCISPELAGSVRPGQFLNLKVSDSNFPLLRRPFSICDVEGDNIFFLFNVHGQGTKMLAGKMKGEKLDVIAPLGNGFNYDDDFDTAVIVAGGLGVAPFPFLTKRLFNKEIFSFIGGRTENDVITYGLDNIHLATDDGTVGVKSNVVQLFQSYLPIFEEKKIKVFACGPNAMLRPLQSLLLEKNINGEVSTECAMACGFGICQGCPIENRNDDSRYLLVCKDGPVFNIKDVVL